MPIHFQFWMAGPSFRITDMTNAWKRGVRCDQTVARTIRSDGLAADCLRFAPEDILGDLGALRLDRGGMIVESLDYKALDEECRTWAARFPGDAVLEFRDIRGMDAPRRQLVAGDGKTWSASADEGGVRIADLTDAVNEPRVISSGQPKSAAYVKAAKAWAKVEGADSFSAAWDVLRKAGCNLHYFCAVD